MRITVRINVKNQVTIPAPIRETLGWLPNTEVEFILEGDDVRLTTEKEETSRKIRLQNMLRQLEGSATVKMSTDEIMKLMRGHDQCVFL